MRAEEAAESAIGTQRIELSESANRVTQQQERYRKVMEEVDALIASAKEE